MWRLLVPGLQFVIDCWIALGLFALLAALGLGLWEIRTHDHYPQRSCK